MAVKIRAFLLHFAFDLRKTNYFDLKGRRETQDPYNFAYWLTFPSRVEKIFVARPLTTL